MLMVGAPGSSSASLRGPTVDVSYVDGGHFWISGITSQGPVVNNFSVDGGCSLISSTAALGARH
jgi:hypothetical protein